VCVELYGWSRESTGHVDERADLSQNVIAFVPDIRSKVGRLKLHR
jgi:hypothetical protein